MTRRPLLGLDEQLFLRRRMTDPVRPQSDLRRRLRHGDVVTPLAQREIPALVVSMFDRGRGSEGGRRDDDGRRCWHWCVLAHDRCDGPRSLSRVAQRVELFIVFSAVICGGRPAHERVQRFDPRQRARAALTEQPPRDHRQPDGHQQRQNGDHQQNRFHYGTLNLNSTATSTTTSTGTPPFLAGTNRHWRTASIARCSSPAPSVRVTGPLPTLPSPRPTTSTSPPPSTPPRRAPSV